MIKKILKFLVNQFSFAWIIGKILSSSVKYIGFKIRYNQDEIITAHYPYFQNDPKFVRAIKSNFKYDKIKRDTINHDWRIHILLTLAHGVCKNLKGDLIEFGVFRGDCAMSIMNYCNLNTSNKTFYLLDSFDGFSVSQLTKHEKELRSYKQFKDSYNFVKRKFFKYKCVSIIKGYVPESLKKVSSKKFCFAHIDMNASYPEKKAFLYIYPLLVQGGIIIFDDYGHAGHEEQKIVLEKVALSFGRVITVLPTGQGMLIK